VSNDVIHPPFTVNQDGKEIIIRVRSDLMSRDELESLLDCAFLQKFAKTLALSEAEIQEMAKEAKRSAWERLRPMVEAKLRERDAVSRKPSGD
jgi:hypothetical protein